LGVKVFGGVSKLSLETLPDLLEGDQMTSLSGMSSMPNLNEVLFLRAGLSEIKDNSTFVDSKLLGSGI